MYLESRVLEEKLRVPKTNNMTQNCEKEIDGAERNTFGTI